jgi:aryl-alcohol dehydrogenase-like predicted oxidoreductase
VPIEAARGVNGITRMERSLGRTRLLASPIGLGLAALGRPGYINVGHGDDLGRDRRRDAMERGTHSVLDAAYARGVRYFDVARSYGLAEAFLASWLERRVIAPGSVTVGSKWGYTYTADWRVDAPTHEVKSHSLPVLTRQLAESRAILGDHLALYQIHSATMESGVLTDDSIIDALADARDGGLRIGLTVSGVAQSETIWRALDVRREGERVFDTVQATWNLLERDAELALSAAHAEGLGVIVKEALANGRLTGRGIDGADLPRIDIVAREAERLEVSIDALALASALAQPWVDVVLSGAATVWQLESNLHASALTISEQTESALQAMRMDSAEYWRRRSALRWN